MAPIAVGDLLPEVTLAWFDENGQMQQLSLHSLAAGKKVIVFGVPGAFTPVCRCRFKLDLSDKGLGTRSRRFALLADDLVVKVANVEEGGEFTICGADDILMALR